MKPLVITNNKNHFHSSIHPSIHEQEEHQRNKMLQIWQFQTLVNFMLYRLHQTPSNSLTIPYAVPIYMKEKTFRVICYTMSSCTRWFVMWLGSHLFGWSSAGWYFSNLLKSKVNKCVRLPNSSYSNYCMYLIQESKMSVNVILQHHAYFRSLTLGLFHSKLTGTLWLKKSESSTAGKSGSSNSFPFCKHSRRSCSNVFPSACVLFTRVACPEPLGRVML